MAEKKNTAPVDTTITEEKVASTEEKKAAAKEANAKVVEAVKEAAKKNAKATEAVAKDTAAKTKTAAKKAATTTKATATKAAKATKATATKAAKATKATAEKAATRTYNKKPTRTAVVQCMGREIFEDELFDRALAQFAATESGVTVKDIKLYIKPEEMTAYYVINEQYTGKVGF